MGGRSRAAAQLLKGKGFTEVYNLAGGIKAWQGLTASGPEEMGMALLSGDETPAEAIKLAYGIEVGLGEFYRKMAESGKDSQLSDLLLKLANIEEKHKLKLLELFNAIDQASIEKEVFEKDIESSVMEGGFTTQEFIEQYRPVMQTVADVISIAMMLETQALDLYMRYADKSKEEKAGEVFLILAEEEKGHLKRLGNLLNEKV